MSQEPRFLEGCRAYPGLLDEEPLPPRRSSRSPLLILAMIVSGLLTYKAVAGQLAGILLLIGILVAPMLVIVTVVGTLAVWSRDRSEASDR